LIQSQQIDHPLLKLIVQHDYKAMYESELSKRREFFYPPFTRLIHLTFKHKLKDVVERSAYHFSVALRNRYEQYVVGPAEPVIGKIRNLYLSEILLKLPRDSKLITQCKKDILQQVAVMHADKSYRSVVMVPDVDPV
jgi:primosomal protein N' (replication factor Y)